VDIVITPGNNQNNLPQEAVRVETVKAKKCPKCEKYFDKSECPWCAALAE
jgi:hypothetical protein